METSEPKWVNSILNIIEVNSLRLGGIYFIIKNHSVTGMLCNILLTLYPEGYTNWRRDLVLSLGWSGDTRFPWHLAKDATDNSFNSLGHELQNTKCILMCP